MSNPTPPSPASLPVVPPIFNIPFIDPKTGLLTQPAFIWLQSLWAAIFGSIGVVDLESYIISQLQAPPFEYSSRQAYVPFFPTEGSVKTSNDGFGFCAAGLLLDGEFLGSAVWGFNMSFPSTKIPDEVSAEFMATADAIFNLIVGGMIVGDTVSGGSVVGTITFSAGTTTGTVSWMSGAGYTLATGTPLMLTAPSPNDATLSSIVASIYGNKN